MLIRRLSILLVAAAVSGGAFAAEPPDLQIKTTQPGATVTFEKSLADGKALVAVTDAKKEPVLGLALGDFEVSKTAATAKVVSVEPLSKTVEVPRHVVMVLDNSNSMVERDAVKKVLEGFGAVLKTIRPIDDVRLVVLRDEKTVKLGGRTLHVEVFQSNKPAELEAFANAAYGKKATTANTFLCEAMFAGLETIRAMPVDEPRFLMVFSDGEELNSAFKGDVVLKTAKEVPNLRVYAIDYMPGPKLDELLGNLAGQNQGQAWKAAKAAELPPLFQKFASKLEQHYVVSWEFPPPPVPAPPTKVAAPPPPPARKVMAFDHAALFEFNKWNLKPEGKEQLKAYREKTMAEMSSASKVKITGHTDNVGKAGYNMKLSLKRAEAVRDYLLSLGGDPAKMEVRGVGMDNPIADNKTAAGRAQNRRVEVEIVGLGK